MTLTRSGRWTRRLYLGLGLLAAIVQIFTFATGLSSLSDTWHRVRGHGPPVAEWVSAHEFSVFFPVMLAFIILMFASAQRIEPSQMFDSPRSRLAILVVWHSSLVITVIGGAAWFAAWAFLGFPWR